MIHGYFQQIFLLLQKYKYIEIKKCLEFGSCLLIWVNLTRKPESVAFQRIYRCIVLYLYVIVPDFLRLLKNY